MRAIIISVSNQKGGVGKTTSTVNLARALVEAGWRVLVIDSDPQSSLSIVYGIDPHRLRELDATGKTFYFGLVKDTALDTLVIDGAPSLIPASIRLANAETELVSPFGVATMLKKKIAPLRECFDFILIDCPPTLSLLTVNALTASNAVVIPCKTDYLSIMGIPLLMDTIDNVRRRANVESKAALELFPIDRPTDIMTASDSLLLASVLGGIAHALGMSVMGIASTNNRLQLKIASDCSHKLQRGM